MPKKCARRIRKGQGPLIGGKNRKLAKIKPYEIALLLEQMADREGKTLLKVDSYKTSQVEFGTQYQKVVSVNGCLSTLEN